MSEKPKFEKESGSNELQEFKRRLLDADLELDFNKFASGLDTEEDVEGEYNEEVKQQSAANTEEFAGQISEIDKNNLTRDKSPVFSAEGKRIKLREINRLFLDLLISEGFPSPIAHKIMSDHIHPSAARIAENNHDERKDSVDEDNPFSALGELAGKKKEERNILNELWFTHLHLMQNILNNPEQFGIDTEDFQRGFEKKIIIEPDELMNRLENSALSDLFVENGVRIDSRSIFSSCRKLIKDKLANIENSEQVTDFLLKKFVNTYIYLMHKTEENVNSLPVHEVKIELGNIDAELGKFLADLLDEGDESTGRKSGAFRYTQLMAFGKESPDNQVYVPEVSLRLPLMVSKERDEAKSIEEKHQIEFEYYKRLVSEGYKEEDKEELLALYTAAETEKYVDLDEAGDKPFRLIMAEVFYSLKNSGYSEEETMAALGTELPNYFSMLKGLRDEVYELRKKADSSEVELRGVYRRIDKLNLDLVTAVKNRIDDTSGIIKSIDDPDSVKLLTSL